MAYPAQKNSWDPRTKVKRIFEEFDGAAGALGADGLTQRPK